MIYSTSGANVTENYKKFVLSEYALFWANSNLLVTTVGKKTLTPSSKL